MEEILERQLLIRGRAFATFSKIEKALAGRKIGFSGPHAVPGPLLCRPALMIANCCQPLLTTSTTNRLANFVHLLKTFFCSTPILNNRLKDAGISDEVLNDAVAQFILEIIVKHGKPAKRFCNKDPMILTNTRCTCNVDHDI